MRVDAVVRFPNTAVGYMPKSVFRSHCVPRVKKIPHTRANLFVELKFSRSIRVINISHANAHAAGEKRNPARAGAKVITQASIEREKVGGVRSFLSTRSHLQQSFQIPAKPMIRFHDIRQHEPALYLREPKIVRHIRASVSRAERPAQVGALKLAEGNGSGMLDSR